GLEGLVRQMPHASFPFIVSNYDFRDTVLHEKTLLYKVFDKAGIRVGVLGVGIELQGLVPEKLFGATQYLDPLDRATETADLLRHEQKCDYIICLSHLGYRYAGDRIDDLKFAKGSRNIDLILGGHTHTFMREPEVLSNQEGKPVIVNQVGWAGIMLGRIDVHFEKNRPNRCVTCKNQVVR
ncbi:MAG: bifunctional metallophosphatase/5'-nucleotidase, partial [Saprospiraceae bacterium]|nr:bifunctional metallophosphatase/5'-nucleotidase [Saprospiraceae bacterium]